MPCGLGCGFRLEMNGVLRSWAIPKGRSQRPGVRRLAIEVEDHPLEYINCDGAIPKGQCGAGRVQSWDTGTYTLEKAEPDEVKVVLHGTKLNGAFVFGRMKKQPKNWMLLRPKTNGEKLSETKLCQSRVS
ncbi:MAG: DNA polymerase ligase N-terminal domain-containing protein [Candidatus Binatia bacterium]